MFHIITQNMAIHLCHKKVRVAVQKGVIVLILVVARSKYCHNFDS